MKMNKKKIWKGIKKKYEKVKKKNEIWKWIKKMWK